MQVPVLTQGAGTCTLFTESTGTSSTQYTRARIGPSDSPRWSTRPRVFRPRRPQLETLPEYAARLLRYSLAVGPYALDQDQRALADMAAQRAVSQLRGLDGLASKLDPTTLQTSEKLSRLRHLLAWLDRQQQALDRASASRSLDHPLGGMQGGRLAPLSPPPLPRPPVGTYADSRAVLDRPRPDGIRF